MECDRISAHSDESLVLNVEEESGIYEADVWSRGVGREILFRRLKFPGSRFGVFVGAGEELVPFVGAMALHARMLNECYGERISMSGIGWSYV